MHAALEAGVREKTENSASLHYKEITGAHAAHDAMSLCKSWFFFFWKVSFAIELNSPWLNVLQCAMREWQEEKIQIQIQIHTHDYCARFLCNRSVMKCILIYLFFVVVRWSVRSWIDFSFVHAFGQSFNRVVADAYAMVDSGVALHAYFQFFMGKRERRTFRQLPMVATFWQVPIFFFGFYWMKFYCFVDGAWVFLCIQPIRSSAAIIHDTNHSWIAWSDNDMCNLSEAAQPKLGCKHHGTDQTDIARTAQYFDRSSRINYSAILKMLPFDKSRLWQIWEKMVQEVMGWPGTWSTIINLSLFAHMLTLP